MVFRQLLPSLQKMNPAVSFLTFGFSEQGAAYNADALGVDPTNIEALVLSHGHMDHFGGLIPLVERIGKKNIELILHPTAFRKSRHIKVSEDKDQVAFLERGKDKRSGGIAG